MGVSCVKAKADVPDRREELEPQTDRRLLRRVRPNPSYHCSYSSCCYSLGVEDYFLDFLLDGSGFAFPSASISELMYLAML